jgi:glycosyltransferase involved in cell wall biosynthesis
MRIVNIIQRYPPAVGGSETWAQEVCRHLAREGHDVRVLTLDINKEEEYWRDPLDEDRTLALGPLQYDERVLVRRYRRSLPIYSVYHLFYRRVLDAIFGVYFYGPHSGEMYGRMWREIRRADVVFLHTQPHPHNFLAFAVAKLFRKTTVIVPHFHPSHPYYERRSNYALLRHCDAVIADSEFERDYLAAKGIRPERLFVAGTGVDPADYVADDVESFRRRLMAEFDLQPEDRVITFLGRKMPDKGIAYLIDAVRTLSAEMPLRLFLAGPRTDWFTQLYEAIPAAARRRIIDLGMLSHRDKVRLLHLTDLLTLPSRYEAFGIVFLEAWICGVPVLGTTRGAMPSIIGSEGFLSEYGDAESLAAAIRDAFADPARLRAYGERGRDKVLRQYTWKTIGDKTARAIRATHQRRKVLVCTNAYPPHFIGGAELIAHAHAKALQQRGNQVLVFAGEVNAPGEHYSMRTDSHEGVPVHRVSLRARDYSAEYCSFVNPQVERQFEDVLDEFAPDVVHLHNLVGLSAGLIRAASRRGIKTVLTLHDHWGFCLKNTLLKSPNTICDDFTRCRECLAFVSDDRWQRVPIRMRKDYIALQMEAVDTFIAPSAYLATAYIKAGIPKEKLANIWYGIDVDRLARLRKTPRTDRVRFTFIGYLARHKGIDTLLEALPLLDRERVLLNIVGEGHERSDYEARAQQLGVAEMVRFWGKLPHSHIERVLRETDVFVLPSIWPENQPITITEAMAAHTPVIASRLGGIPELVDDGRTGYLFTAGDAVDLASKMRQLVVDPSRIDTFGDAAFEKIVGNTVERHVDALTQVYEAPRALQPRVPDNVCLIACAGQDVDPPCADAIVAFEERREPGARFCMADWLDEDQLRAARVLWVVDPHATIRDVLPALINQVPLLVPQSNSELTDLVRYGRCGLYYQDAEDAVRCLIRLADDAPLRAQLGQNGFALFYASLSPQRSSYAAPLDVAEPLPVEHTGVGNP